MTLQILPVDMLHIYDNWNWLIRDEANNVTAVVDPCEAAGVQILLDEKGWQLDVILNTHHHWDHTNGNLALKQRYGCKVVGAASDAERIKGIDVKLSEGDRYMLGDYAFTVIDVSGHTLGHIAYYCEAAKALFAGDALFAMGCGRIAEGTAQMCYDSLQKLAALPDDTRLYAAHEYTVANGRFARSVEPDNDAINAHIEEAKAKRRQKQPSLPSSIGQEKASNPFLRTESSVIRAHFGLSENALGHEVFAALRAAKDAF